ncbi:hypothetical protein [Nocardia sp. NBC_00403]|uniref:hypothetical protein n=1 Tax=Nocardia sp. NBC_00403 TaxID=2975990 RepID=UPI002E1AA1D3
MTNDEKWGAWSANRITETLDSGRVVINPIIYTEVPSDTTPSKIWTICCLPMSSSMKHCRSVPAFWQERHFSATAAMVARSGPQCPTST